MKQKKPAAMRPYRLLCAFCALGADDPASVAPKTAAFLKAVGKRPDMPVTLQCNLGGVFAFQDPGPADDMPGGPEFNLGRDLEILYRLNLSPGVTLPARVLLHRVLDTIEDVAAMCGPAGAARGCDKACSGAFKRGREKGIGGLIAARPEAEMKQAKAESLDAMYKSDAVAVRPHILACAVCQYGGGTRPPFPDDNLPELIQLILKKPDTLIRLAPGADWMMCAPCPSRAAGSGGCVINKGSGELPNQMRDLRVLRKLGIAFGSVVKARDLYKLLLERVPGTLELCRIEHSKPSVWWSNCGAATANSEAYDKGRRELMAILGL